MLASGHLSTDSLGTDGTIIIGLRASDHSTHPARAPQRATRGRVEGTDSSPRHQHRSERSSETMYAVELGPRLTGRRMQNKLRFHANGAAPGARGATTGWAERSTWVRDPRWHAPTPSPRRIAKRRIRNDDQLRPTDRAPLGAGNRDSYDRLR